MSRGGEGAPDAVRALFGRMVKAAGGKRRRTEMVFARWAVWEAGVGGGKGVERVKALEEQWRSGLDVGA